MKPKSAALIGLTALVVILILVGVPYLSQKRQANAVYDAANAVCSRSNETRKELNDLYSAFETHNTITGDLFSIVGESLPQNTKVAKAFTRFSIQYKAITHEYDNIQPIDCDRVIVRP